MNSLQNIIFIPKPELFSFAECLHFLDRGYDDCLYSIENDTILKPLHIDNQPVLVKVREENVNLSIEIIYGEASPEKLQKAADYVMKWFDMEQDLRPFYRLLSQHTGLAFMQEQYRGLRLMGIPDLFEALCWCVIGQQINLNFAHRLKRRLVEKHGSVITCGSSRHHYFPEPEQLAGLTVAELRELQFSRQKAEYLIGISKEFAEGTISQMELKDLSGTRPMLQRLMNIRGVGEWTANYVLMKSLKRMDCITYGDTGLQSAISSFLELARKPTREEVETFFEPFAGWESYLVIYLWRTLS